MTRSCPVCGAEIQRTPDGTLSDGMSEHMATVHPEKVLAVVRP